MSMVVQHNLTAMNANRQLGVTTSSQAKATEKLSSGYRINRAGDDAAGLKISEKMRSQVRGLTKASTNAQDGVSLIQTAEGALNEAHSILQRMNELAVQGANDTNESIDRDAINEELEALTTELDRISSTTQFNKQNLLDGSFQDKNLHVGANANQRIAISIGNMDATTLGLRKITGSDGEAKVQEGLKPNKYVYGTVSGNYTATSSMDWNKKVAISAVKQQVSTVITASQYAPKFDTSVYYVGNSDGQKYATLSKAMAVDKSAYKQTVSKDITANFTNYITTSAVEAKSASPLTPSGDFDLKAPNVSTYARANATISAVQEAINRVSSQRSALGALQNRLEHTIANLDNVAENTQAAESRIRDTDMASQMVEYSKNNILAQAGQSMLAQANQSNQGVLSLLG
ncbi:flagellin N-terminal helical domain-containing protein [Lactobacillus taiwanensis]|uniref:flagellin N-terminal helical domain-containing protein n=1 Tax=Lactobacillus taiwanensis TaxID=508451 RepID=UPI00272B2E92|nr:flagellin [Lactobacillus taiwanensis]